MRVTLLQALPPSCRGQFALARRALRRLRLLQLFQRLMQALRDQWQLPLQQLVQPFAANIVSPVR